MEKVTTFFTGKEWKEIQDFLQDSDMSLYALLKHGALQLSRELRKSSELGS